MYNYFEGVSDFITGKYKLEKKYKKIFLFSSFTYFINIFIIYYIYFILIFIKIKYYKNKVEMFCR